MSRHIPPREALTAAKKLIDSIDLTEEEASVILGMAIERYQSVRQIMKRIGLSRRCVSAVFAAALEYSETIADHDS